MASYNRFEKKKGEPYNKGCGGLLWDAWGGEEGIRWAEGKLDEINSIESKIDLTSKEIDGRPQNAKYTTDYDLLPKKHPKSSKK